MLLSMTCIAQRKLFKCENCKQTASHSSTLPREDRALQRTSNSNHSTYLQSHHPCSMEHLSRPASRTQNSSSMRRDCSFHVRQREQYDCIRLTCSSSSWYAYQSFSSSTQRREPYASNSFTYLNYTIYMFSIIFHIYPWSSYLMYSWVLLTLDIL